MKYNRSIAILSVTTIVSIIIVFTFSSQNGNISYGISGTVLEMLTRMGVRITEYNLRKMAHVIIYLLLGASSCALAISFIRKTGVWNYVCGATVSIAFCYICAFLDEWNQHYVTGRTGKWTDVGPDAIGFITGSIVVAICLYVGARKQGAKKEKET